MGDSAFIHCHPSRPVCVFYSVLGPLRLLVLCMMGDSAFICMFCHPVTLFSTVFYSILGRLRLTAWWVTQRSCVLSPKSPSLAIALCFLLRECTGIHPTVTHMQSLEVKHVRHWGGRGRMVCVCERAAGVNPAQWHPVRPPLRPLCHHLFCPVSQLVTLLIYRFRFQL